MKEKSIAMHSTETERRLYKHRRDCGSHEKIDKDKHML